LRSKIEFCGGSRPARQDGALGGDFAAQISRLKKTQTYVKREKKEIEMEADKIVLPNHPGGGKIADHKTNQPIKMEKKTVYYVGEVSKKNKRKNKVFAGAVPTGTAQEKRGSVRKRVSLGKDIAKGERSVSQNLGANVKNLDRLSHQRERARKAKTPSKTTG